MKKIHVFYYIFISIVCLLFCSYTLAQTSMVSGPTQAISKTFVVLLGVVGLIIGLAWLSKFFGINNLAGHKDIKAIAQIPLGQREKAVLIDVYGKKILLGVSHGSVNTLHVFNTVTSETLLVNNRSNEKKSSQDELTEDEVNYKDLLPREYDDELPLPRANVDDLKSLKNISKEASEFSSFIKKIISNGNISR